MAADGGGKTGLSKSQKALARRLAERIGDSMLPGETALSAARLFDAADFLLEAALVRSDGQPSILLRSAPGGRTMRLAVINDDMPFLVDSVASAVAAQGLAIDVLAHPIVTVERKSGKLTSLTKRAGTQNR